MWRFIAGSITTQTLNDKGEILYRVVKIRLTRLVGVKVKSITIKKPQSIMDSIEIFETANQLESEKNLT